MPIFLGDVLVVTGGDLTRDDVFVIDLSGSDRNCSLPKLPDILDLHAMALENDQPLYCGGEFNGYDKIYLRFETKIVPTCAPFSTLVYFRQKVLYLTSKQKV